MANQIGEKITVSANGMALTGFQKVTINRSAQKGAMAFVLTATSSTGSQQAQALISATSLEIDTNGTLLCTGAVDDYTAEYGEGEYKLVTIEGRSQGRNAIDCPPVDHPTGNIQNKTLVQAANELDEFGVGWSTDQQLAPIPNLQIQPGEPMFDTIERYARYQGLLLVAQTDGSIKITRSGSSRHSGCLTSGCYPLKSFSVKKSPKAKFQPVVVRSQQDGTSTNQSDIQQEARDQGDGSEHRPHMVIGESHMSQDDLAVRGSWRRKRLGAGSIGVYAIVDTWRDASGTLWEPGYIIAVSIPQESINQDFAVGAVDFEQDEKGTRARLELVDPVALGGAEGQGDQNSDMSVGESNTSSTPSTQPNTNPDSAPSTDVPAPDTTTPANQPEPDSLTT